MNIVEKANLKFLSFNSMTTEIELYQLAKKYVTFVQLHLWFGDLLNENEYMELSEQCSILFRGVISIPILKLKKVKENKIK